MTRDGVLADLDGRLCGGVARAAMRTRPGGRTADDGDALNDDLDRLIGELHDRVRPVTLRVSAVDARLDEIADWLRANRPALLALLFVPHEALDRLPGTAAGVQIDAVGHWLALAWLAEAAWRATAAATPGTPGTPGAGFATGDLDLLRPLAARVRFLALSEPMRHRPAAKETTWGPDDDYGEHGIAGQVFGDGGWNTLVGRCREARHIWRRHLDEYQTHPYLATARPEELEAELDALLFATGRRPLTLSVEPLGTPARPNAEDRAVLEQATEQHLLPRFRLGKVIALGCHAGRRAERIGRPAVAAASAVTALTAIGCAAVSWFTTAMWLAVAAYLLVGAGTVLFGRAWTAMWLLRLPAAATVGLLVLISLPEDWSVVAWQAPAVLAAGSYGYLVIEARNHGVAPGRALGRAAAVAGLGACHTALIVIIGLVALAPALGAKDVALAALWRREPTYGHVGYALLLGMAWCLAVGVFSQILWEDRPITASLAHLSWRSER